MFTQVIQNHAFTQGLVWCAFPALDSAGPCVYSSVLARQSPFFPESSPAATSFTDGSSTGLIYAPQRAWVNGSGNGISYSGANPATTSFDPSVIPFSFAFWGSSPNENRRTAAIQCGDEAGAGNNQFELMLNSNHLAAANPGQVAFVAYNGGYQLSCESTSTSLVDGNLHLYMWTKPPSTGDLVLYVDGISQAVGTTLNNSLAFSLDNFVVFGSRQTANRAATSTVAGFYWNYQMSAAQAYAFAQNPAQILVQSQGLLY